jgi:hypothetical protein
LTASSTRQAHARRPGAGGGLALGFGALGFLGGSRSGSLAFLCSAVWTIVTGLKDAVPILETNKIDDCAMAEVNHLLCLVN